MTTMGRSSKTTLVSATCFGVCIEIECPESESAAVAAHLPVHSKFTSVYDLTHKFALEPVEGNLFCVRCGGSRKAPAQPLDVALRSLQKELQLCVAERATSCVFIHAGVVQMNGITMIFPGYSHAGKSTLVWSLLQAGAVYYSDEYAVFDEQGAIHPFPSPLHLRSPDGDRQLIVSNRVGPLPHALQVVVFVTFEPHSVWQPRILRPSETMMQLIRNSIGIRRNPSFVLPIIRKVSMQARAFAGVRGEAAQVVQWAQQMLFLSQFCIEPFY